MLEGQTQYKGILPPLAPVNYTTRDGTPMTSDYAYSGLVTLLVSEAATETEVRSTVTSEGGTVIDALPAVGIYTVQASPEHVPALISGLIKKPFVIDAAPSSPITASTRASVIDSFAGPDNGCSPHGRRVKEVVEGITGRPVKEIEVQTPDMTSAMNPLPGLQVVGNWYPVLGRKLISEMEDAQKTGERVTIGMSLGPIMNNVGYRKNLGTVCNSSATPLAMDCRVAQQEELLFLEQIYQTVQRAPQAVRKNAAIVVSSGNAGVDLTAQIARLNRQYPDAATSIKIVGATDDEGSIYRRHNYASSGLVYALGIGVPTAGAISCSGTSFSAPVIVGVLDEMWNAAPGLTSDQLNEAFDDALRSCPDAAPSGNIVPHNTFGTTAGWFTACAVDRARIKAGMPPSPSLTTTLPATRTATISITPPPITLTVTPAMTGTTAPVTTKIPAPVLTTITPKTPPSGPLVFSAGSLPSATTGNVYRYSFCMPSPATVTSLCGPGTSNPSGGNPPYHFELGAGVGFPPMGISLNLNGLLTGKPASTGTSRFQVCAVDLSQNKVCRDVELVVEGGSLTGNWQGSWQIGVDVSGFCPNMGMFSYGGPLAMQLTDTNGALSGSGSISGVKSLNIAGDMSCSPVDAGSFDFSVSGSRQGSAVRMILDFGNPDLFIPSLDFDGTASENVLSGTLSCDMGAAGQASATRQ
jgi:hypothetical protein